MFGSRTKNIPSRRSAKIRFFFLAKQKDLSYIYLSKFVSPRSRDLPIVLLIYYHERPEKQ